VEFDVHLIVDSKDHSENHSMVVINLERIYFCSLEGYSYNWATLVLSLKGTEMFWILEAYLYKIFDPK
jgi:hypothetical protein